MHDFLNDFGGDGEEYVMESGGVGGDDEEAGEDEINDEADEEDDLACKFNNFCSILSQSSDCVVPL